MNSVISFRAAQLYTVSSIVTLIQYPRAVIQFSVGRWSLYYAKKNNHAIYLQWKEART